MHTGVQLMPGGRPSLRGVFLAAVGDWIYADDHNTIGGLHTECLALQFLQLAVHRALQVDS